MLIGPNCRASGYNTGKKRYNVPDITFEKISLSKHNNPIEVKKDSEELDHAKSLTYNIELLGHDGRFYDLNSFEGSKDSHQAVVN